MEKETINNIFEFIKKNNNKNKPLRWKLINNEPLTDDELNIEGNLIKFIRFNNIVNTYMIMENIIKYLL
jgi:hypothetical protein